MPPLAQLVEVLVGYLQDHGIKILTALILMAVGWFFGHRRARHAWNKREFLDRLNVSLNSIENGTLTIRTLSELHCEEVFLNKIAAQRVTEAAKRTTAKDPLLPFSQEDYWHYLNAVLNHLSEQFTHGHVRKDLGAPVATGHYLVCLTCECAGELRTRKVRAMLIRKDLLTKLPETPPKFVETRHQTRWTTLQAMAAEYARNPWRFLEVTLSV